MKYKHKLIISFIILYTKFFFTQSILLNSDNEESIISDEGNCSFITNFDGKMYTVKRVSSLNVYFRIINFYGDLRLYNANKDQIKILNGNEEEYNFEFKEKNYYITYNPPTPFRNCTFIVMSSINDEFTNTIKFYKDFQDYADLYLYEKREFNILVKNEESNNLFVYLNLEGSPQGPFLETATAIENGKSFTPLYEKKINSVLFYFYLDNEFNFKPSLYSDQSKSSQIIYNYTKATVTMNELT